MTRVAGWPLVPLAEVAESIDYGFTDSANTERVGPRFLRITDIQNGAVDWNTVPFCGYEGNDLDRFGLRAGDIVFARTGATTGKSFLIRECPEPAVFASYLIRVRPGRNVDPTFLSRFFETPAYWLQITQTSSGTAQPGVNASKLQRLKIPLPPLAEQKRIAAVLDKADDLRGKRRQALATLDRLQSAAFMDFFQRSAKAPPITIRADIPATGEGWRWRLLTEVGRLATGHTPDRKRPEYWDGDIPWITLSNIRELDGAVAMDTDEHTTEAGINHSSAVKLPAGTVCFSRTASVGFVTVMGREMCTSQDFVNWVCGPELVPDYLMWSFIYSRESLRSLSSGSTHNTIYFPTVERFCVLLPPVELQRRFARIAEGIRSEKLRQARSLETADTLFASLQSRVFAGTLFDSEAAIHPATVRPAAVPV